VARTLSNRAGSAVHDSFSAPGSLASVSPHGGCLVLSLGCKSRQPSTVRNAQRSPPRRRWLAPAKPPFREPNLYRTNGGAVRAAVSPIPTSRSRRPARSSRSWKQTLGDSERLVPRCTGHASGGHALAWRTASAGPSARSRKPGGRALVLKRMADHPSRGCAAQRSHVDSDPDIAANLLAVGLHADRRATHPCGSRSSPNARTIEEMAPTASTRGASRRERRRTITAIHGAPRTHADQCLVKWSRA
jgi:hypothetical protein